MARGPRDRGPKALTTEDRRIWARVAGSVTPPKSRKAARVTPGAAAPPEGIVEAGSGPVKPGSINPPSTPPGRLPPKPPPKAASRAASIAPPPAARPRPVIPRAAPAELEPRRHRRLSRERDPIEATIDLHGFGRFDAEDQLRAFLCGCQARGLRAVLVITGQGRLGGGVIRASVHEWLHAPALRAVVSGFAVSHRRHGGDGAIYVTLKKR